jgi:CsoR family transcriptional regulator, copper-sensing transcriptional repressor
VAATQPRTSPKELEVRGYTLDKNDYLTRLRKIEGQVRGLQRLIEADTYCIDVLTQIASVNAALKHVALGLVDQHLRRCVIDAMNADADQGDRRLHEATLAVQRLIQL